MRTACARGDGVSVTALVLVRDPSAAPDLLEPTKRSAEGRRTHHSTFWSVACRLLVCVKNRFAIALQARSSSSAAVVGGERKRRRESRTHQSEVEMTSPTTKKWRKTNESTVLSVATAP